MKGGGGHGAMPLLFIPIPMAMFGMLTAFMFGATLGMLMGRKHSMMGGPGHRMMMWKKGMHHHHGMGGPCMMAHGEMPEMQGEEAEPAEE